MRRIILWISLASAFLPLCALAEENAKPRPEPKPRGDRILAIGVNDTLDGSYEKAFAEAGQAGLQEVVLAFEWRDLETGPGLFFPYPNFLGLANLFFPYKRTHVHLILAPIHTNQDTRPWDLVGKAFDDPIVIARFRQLLDFVFAEIPDLEVSSLSIGTEVDIFLGQDERRWQAYEAFYREAAEYARQKRMGLRVAAEATFAAFSGKGAAYLKRLNRHSDLIGVSYYPVKDDFSVQPLSEVPRAFQTVLALVPDKPVVFYQIGFPSGEGSRSSPELQAEFIREVFAAWDAHADRIRMLHLGWMNDISPAAAETSSLFYDLKAPASRHFFGSLGLRTETGEEKPAWKALKEEARARGW